MAMRCPGISRTTSASQRRSSFAPLAPWTGRQARLSGCATFGDRRPKGHRPASLELALPPAADHQTGLEVGAKPRVIVGEEAVIVAVVWQLGLRADGAGHRHDRVRILFAQHVLEGLE